MAPRRTSAQKADDAPAELFTSRHAAEFEEDRGLPYGSVELAYRVRFGDLAKYVLQDLISNPPIVNSRGILVWPVPLPQLERSNATVGFRNGRRTGIEWVEDTDNEEPDPYVPGPGLKRSGAHRRKNEIRPRSRSPPKVNTDLQRRGAVHKKTNPLTKTKRSPTEERRAQQARNYWSNRDDMEPEPTPVEEPGFLRRSSRVGLGEGARDSKMNLNEKSRYF